MVESTYRNLEGEEPRGSRRLDEVVGCRMTACFISNHESKMVLPPLYKLIDTNTRRELTFEAFLGILSQEGFRLKPAQPVTGYGARLFTFRVRRAHALKNSIESLLAASHSRVGDYVGCDRPSVPYSSARCK